MRLSKIREQQCRASGREGSNRIPTSRKHAEPKQVQLLGEMRFSRFS